MNVREMLVARAQVVDDQTALLNKAKVEKRGLTNVEEAEYQSLERRIGRYEEDIRNFEGIPVVTGNFNDDLAHFEQRRRNQLREPSGSLQRSSHGYLGRTADNENAIFCRYLRTGDEGALAEARASNATDMNIGTPADGGYAVPTGHYNRIIAKARPAALYSQLGVQDMPGQGTTVNVPVDAEGDNGAFVVTSEGGEFDLDAPALGSVAMTLVKYTKKIEFSVELLEDEDSKLLNFIEGYVGSGLAATLNTALVTEVLANGTAALTLDAPTSIGASEIPELIYTLPDAYATGPNVAWLMRRTTEGFIRGKTGDNFQFVPTPSGQMGPQAQLFGYPVFNSSDVGALAGGGKSLVFGNWNYVGVRFGPTLQFLRDPYTLGHLGKVRLLYFVRFSFKVLQAEAIRYATQPTG